MPLDKLNLQTYDKEWECFVNLDEEYSVVDRDKLKIIISTEPPSYECSSASRNIENIVSQSLRLGYTVSSLIFMRYCLLLFT